MWIMQDTENTGQISKDQCKDLAKKVLKKIEQENLYNESAFEILFVQFDPEESDQFSKERVV